MTDNTEVKWEANGQSLHTYAWSVQTKAHSGQAGAGKRGDDYALPFGQGHRRVPKLRDARFIALPMWIAGVNQDGSPDGSMSEEAKLDNNWDYLMGLMDVSGQFPLVKRKYIGTDIVSMTAMAEMLDPPEPSYLAKNTWQFVLTLKLVDPWFYTSEVTAAVGTINVQGQMPTTHVRVSMGAGRVTFPDGNWIEYAGSGTATFDCNTGNAKVGTQYVNGLFTRNRRFPTLPILTPGANVLTGSGTVKYDPAYR